MIGGGSSVKQHKDVAWLHIFVWMRPGKKKKKPFLRKKNTTMLCRETVYLITDESSLSAGADEDLTGTIARGAAAAADGRRPGRWSTGVVFLDQQVADRERWPRSRHRSPGGQPMRGVARRSSGARGWSRAYVRALSCWAMGRYLLSEPMYSSAVQVGGRIVAQPYIQESKQLVLLCYH